MNGLTYILTNDSITLVWNGKVYVVRRGAPNFLALRDAISKEDWSKIENHLTAAKSISEWAKGRYAVSGDQILFDGQVIPKELNQRITEMATNNEDPTPIFKFWERLQKNPSARSVQQLWPFLNHQGIPLTKDGTFLAYKGVNDDYTDKHTGTVDNSPGAVNEMPRNKISDDPNQGCHFGYHVGALEYAQGFANRVVICEVDPADVVCIPYDSSFQKMRVCKYKVIGNHNGQLLSSTVEWVDDDEPELDDEPTLDEQDEYINSLYDDREDEESEEPEVQSETPISPAAGTAARLHVNRKFQKFQSMDMGELLEQSMDDLRKYASQGLKIVGASKIPGGKVSLVLEILKVRG